MKLSHPIFSEAFPLQDEKTNVIIIENGALFYSLMKELSLQCEGKEGSFTLSDSIKALSVEKNIDFVGDMFGFSVNERKLATKLLTCLSDKALDDAHFAKTHELMSLIEQYILELISDFDVSVHLENSIDIAMLLKAAPVTVSDICATLPEKICNYAKIENEFFGKKVFAFVNLKQFLSEEDIEDIYKFFRYEKLCLLLFEGYQKYNSDNEHNLIIDKDMCII